MLKLKTNKQIALWLFALFSVFVPGISSALPHASFTADQVAGCAPLNVIFTSTSTGAVSYYWDLGNGNTSSLTSPSNLYTTQGSFTITLIAYDGAGNSDTATYVNFISVAGKPVAGFHVTAATSCLDNNSFSFVNTSTNGATSFLWDFGDGTTSSQPNPSHSYAYSGTFTVTLIASNTFSCQDVKIINQYITVYPKPDATVTAATTASCDPNTVFNFTNNAQNATNWLWNFGDFTTSSSHNPSHTYPGPGNYNVSVIVTNSYGCRDTSHTPVSVSVGLNNWADFSEDVDSGCPALVVQFNNPNANVATSVWNFGDGGTSTAFNPSHTYLQGGVYTVSLIVTTTNGCADTVVKHNLIRVGTKPLVSFLYNATAGCSPLSVAFTNTSVNWVTCKWFFGDGQTSTDPNPVHLYTNSGTFSVTLQCWGPTGCTRSMVYRDIIHVTAPQAIFNATPRVGCPPLTSAFTSLSQATGLTYNWNFGDGSHSTQANPSHTYNTSGTFDVSLIVTDALGCRDTIKKISYIQTVNPAANYVPPPVTTGCAPLTTQFTDATSRAIAWLWNFGDGVTSTLQNPTHSFTTPGSYTVSLTTTSAGGGCSQTISNFSSFDVDGGYAGFTHTVSPCPPYVATFQDTSLNAVSWLWDFGDGSTSTSQNPAHVYTSPGYHSASLTITTADGCSYTTMQSNSVYFTPFGANFYGVPLDTVFPADVQFYANSVGATSWSWDFGDSTHSSLENPLHTYQADGNYLVVLTISNGSCTLTYSPPPFNFGTPDNSPVDVGHGPEPELQQGCAPLNVLFTNRINGAASWHWDFGDGDSSDVQFPFHIYPNPGIYSVRLTTTDTLGIVQTMQMDSIVRVSGPVPGFIISQTASCSNTQITLTDTSKNANSWSWNLGDGNFSTQQNPTHMYAAGTPNYIITQTVSDTLGCTASISTSIFASFVSPLLASETEVCGYDTVHFFTSLQNYASYHWDFGDGTFSSTHEPSHLYNTPGNYTVSLTVTDISNCSQTYFVNPPITVNLPVAAFTTTTGRQGCNELNIRYINQSQNADYYLWNFGDGTISSLRDPLMYTYRQVGVYDVSLTVFSGSCVSTVSYPHYVRVDTAHAEFSLNTNQLCLPSTTTFTDLSVTPASWRWFYGDGDSSHIQNPTHVYTLRPSEYPMLIMIDIHGCKDTARVNSFPFLVAKYETSADSGCFPFTVNFTNKSSLISTSWFWDFGDGTTSTDYSPSHTYAHPGEYDITLIIFSTYANCYDTLFLPGKIKVRQPHSDFLTTDTYACAPSIVNFTDLSMDADHYLWDFGDGTTSTNSNPSHIYNTPGLYTVKLITTSTLGCSDTLVKPRYIRVLGPLTKFIASDLEGCTPFSVTFIDQSQDAVTYSWNFGDGSSDFAQNPMHQYTDTGSFTVSLVASDTAGCTSFYELPQPVIIHPSPHASFNVNNFSGCQPFTTMFMNTSTGMLYYQWIYGDGNSDTSRNANHLFTDAGNYNVHLIVSNEFGCTDTAVSSQPVIVLPTPVPDMSVTDATGCSPFHVIFTNTSTNISGPQYLWNFGNGLTSTMANPAMDFIAPGSYTIDLTVTNANGCSDSVTFPSFINVLDTTPPNETKIFSVSVASDTSVEIIWENNPAIDLAAYKVFRLEQSTNIYRLVYTQTNVQNTNFELTSKYDDSGLNTLLNSYTYKVQAIDLCGFTIPLERLAAHTTVNISSRRAGEKIQVDWTPYGGCQVETYQLFRARQGEDFQFLTTVPGDTLGYLDTTFTCPVPYIYKVMATDLCGNSYNSNSDTSQTIPLNTLDGQIVDVIRSTVIDNQIVLTEWKQPEVHPEMVAQFDIYRSIDNVNFNYVKTVPSVQTDFTDYDVDVQTNHYYYKILVVNTCDVGEDLSTITSTIIIRGTMDESRQVHLEWSPYQGWDNGVDYYILEKKDDQGHWQVLKQVSGTTLRHDYQE